MQVQHVHGSYADAIIYTVDNPLVAIDDYALAQIQQLCDFEAVEGNCIRVMPDVHPGAGCVIGLTMTLASKVVMPNLVGVDIGCGVLVAKLRESALDFLRLDTIIAEKVPSGFDVHEKETAYEALDSLCCAKHVSISHAKKSLGTLGGGNHYIELDRGTDDAIYLVVHTGSRHLGKQVCEWYLKQGRKKHIPYALTFIEVDLAEQYLHDMQIVQGFAQDNRERIVHVIAKAMHWEIEDVFTSVHNYIDFRGSIPLLRKGAIAAGSDERLVIPCNMRDGAILGLGKGNADWNFSAPHGAGRIGSRAQIRKTCTLSAFTKSMEGIYSSCVRADTLDESPFAYRSQEDILGAIANTVVIQDIVKPVYNFKAGGKERG